MKLAVFSGQYFWFDGCQYSTNEAFAKFVISFSAHFEKVIFCDALAPEQKSEPYVLDSEKTSICPLPNFSLYSLWKDSFRSFTGIYNVLSKNIDEWDVVWLHAPHPVSLIFIYICKKHKKPFFFFIRQNLKVYVGCRTTGWLRSLAVLTATILESIFRRLAKNTLTFTVGEEMFDEYKKSSSLVCQASVSLISKSDVDLSEKMARSQNDVPKILSVGRLDPEKGTIYLILAFHELIFQRGRKAFLEVIGTGPEEQRLKDEVHRLGLSSQVSFSGYVSHGEQLLAKYRSSDVYVISSFTEGWPQTLFEAMACCVPIVATRVGGIPRVIEDGVSGMLVSPQAPSEICKAIEQILDHDLLRSRLISNGLSIVREHTMEAECDRVFHALQRHLRKQGIMGE